MALAVTYIKSFPFVRYFTFNNRVFVIIMEKQNCLERFNRSKPSHQVVHTLESLFALVSSFTLVAINLDRTIFVAAPFW